MLPKRVMVILEVFDDSQQSVESLGFEKIRSKDGVEYVFYLDGYEYTVEFKEVSISPSSMPTMFKKMDYVDNKSLIDNIDYERIQTNFLITSINLLGPQNVSTTGLNNFGSVYSRLIASVRDYLSSSSPELIHFAGFEDKMNLVYDRMSSKMLEGPIDDPNKYSRIDTKALMNNGFLSEYASESLLGNLSYIKQEHNEYLSNIRMNKNKDNAKIAQKKEVGTLYRGGNSVYMVIDVVQKDETKYAKLVEVYNKSGDVSGETVKKALPLNKAAVVDPTTLKPNMISQIIAALYEYGEILTNTPTVKNLRRVMEV